jgi:endonuclease III
VKSLSLKASNARLRQFLSGAARTRPEPQQAGRDHLEVLIESVLEADTTRKAAAAARQSLLENYVDLNELRVATPREMAACWPRDFPFAARKGQTLARVLNAVFERSYKMSLEYLKDVPRRELRQHLLGLGLCPYAAARLLMTLYDQPAIPVDTTLVEAMELEGLLPEGASVADVQAMIERLTPARGAAAVHAFLREYVEKNQPAVDRKRKKQQQAVARAERMAAEALAAEKAKARAKAEEEARVAQQAKDRSRSEAKAKVRRAQARKVRASRSKNAKKAKVARTTNEKQREPYAQKVR